MTSGLPTEVEAVLRENGWVPGGDSVEAARTAVATVSEEVGADGSRHEPFPAAVAALQQFGGLYVVQDGPGVALRRRPFALDPTLAAHCTQTLADLARILGTRVFPLGVEGDADAFLAVDEQGRVFAVDPYGEWFLGATVAEAITALVTGAQPSRLGDDGDW